MQKLNIQKDKNYVIRGDCLEWLDHIPSESVDMCYIYPPFFSNATYELIWGNGWEKSSFEDRFKTVRHYADWMKDRFEKINKCLKNTGSIFVHCDHRANYKLREKLDEVFGEENFINEIIWSYRTGGNSPRYFARKHDTIFWYSKTKDKHTYNLIKEKSYLSHKYGFSNIKIFEDEKGLFRLVIPRSIFDIEAVRGNNPESINYKTQKPEALLKKILECSTHENDTVLDCFGGGGTTASVCSQLNRRYIIGDVSPVACRVTIDRLAKLESYPVYPNELRTEKEWKDLDGHLFAEKICMYLGWKCNPKKSNDRGVDGWNKLGEPIQIKNHSKPVGEKVIKELAMTVKLANKNRGLIIAWELSNNAFDAIARLRSKKIFIDFKKVKDILNGILISYDQKEELERLFDPYREAA